MNKIVCLLLCLFSFSTWAQSSMRRCTLLPITDSVGGAIGYKVFQEVENKLKKSNWCTYISNSGMISVFSKYRENLPLYLKNPEVLKTVSKKLKVGSIIRVGIVNEINSVDVDIDIYGENGEDLYFHEKAHLESDNVDEIAQTVSNWLDMYAKIIPYDAKINGILGDQITLDVGKGYPIQIGQEFVVKRPIQKKKHPLLKKIVDWETELLAQGKVFNISDNQALGIVQIYKEGKKLMPGDWVRLEPMKAKVHEDITTKDEKVENPGSLGILSVALFGTASSLDTTAPSGTNRMSGNLLGVDFRAEGWITRQYFAAIETKSSLGSLSKASGTPDKDRVNVNNRSFKLTGGYKYLPIGFFFGPQIDLYGGYGSYTYDIDYSVLDGFGRHTFSGLLFGTAANIPLNREFRFFVQAEFLPFPSFKDSDSIYGTAKSSTSLDIEVGMKYQYRPRITLDASIESSSRKARFNSEYKEVSYKDNILKLGASFNF